MPETVFDGDTFYAFAGYSELPSEPLKIAVIDGKKQPEQEEGDILARLVAARCLGGFGNLK